MRRSWPPTRISPSSGWSSAARRWRRVDLPQPDGPTIATNSPGSTVRSLPVRALMRPSSKLLRRPRAAMAGSLIAQRLHRRKPDGPGGGVGRAEKPDDEAEDDRADEDLGRVGGGEEGG